MLRQRRRIAAGRLDEPETDQTAEDTCKRDPGERECERDASRRVRMRVGSSRDAIKRAAGHARMVPRRALRSSGRERETVR
jgi:hypothetical protein